MYVYDQHDHAIIKQRVQQFRHQTERFLNGELAEAEFLPLRLQNGLYVQRHAPMLRIAIPYGMLNAQQLRKLADITDNYDKGYAHISTRQNMQLNWPNLEQVPDILAELSEVEMHAVQTSGNCIRNTTTDQFSGIAQDEIEDSRPWCEIIRQWSTFHPEYAFLPRKFKIAVNANTRTDRAAIKFHDIGLQIVKNNDGETGFEVWVGGGLGRTPVIAELINPFLPWQHLLSYLESILRVYNLNGRRDNKYKARIKILVKAMGIDAFRDKVEQVWSRLKDSEITLTQTEVDRIKAHFTEPAYKVFAEPSKQLADQLSLNPAFNTWYEHNVTAHKKTGYAAVTLSLKKLGIAPGDISSDQMRELSDLADKYSFSELRTTHQQNIVLADVEEQQLFNLWQELLPLGLATANIGTLTDMICCPGGDFCALANAKSIPIAEAIQKRFEDMDYVYDLGDLDLNISGCMNACGHHHIGNIGVLGVDKKGEEFYQISLGGNSTSEQAAIGKILGPSFKAEEMPDVIEKIINVYIENRQTEENFFTTVHRIGLDPFKERVYEPKVA
ncbi:nitrite/sulfite reductase [Gynuella sunshinyii]|uniref:Sulfite reductase, beta subunit (Hemoprotein) n=1 Tax=Gynuella sunshinyii YC6258 TaxID=1445510 RepID=A0A0C5VLQ4_9GAMM|nr:nitrite/sulfite reductase [Gynuella sunshinyii]AJQ95216.1 sulfite reductase, beta subunit (hemoprotein) [Gynuella sunshinyii YC6258]